jgi:ribosomal protein S18 acetylase RimI-like enzyme
MAAQGYRKLTDSISLRSVILPDDEAFLQKLYASTREDDIAMWGMSEEQAAPLIEMQYRAQKMQYEAQYPGARHNIILSDGEPVGRVMTLIVEKELSGIDIAIVPDTRNRGIGSVVLNDLKREADELGIPFNFSVVKTNHKAIKLYQRLGVEFVGETVSHYLIKWQAK